MLVVDFVVKIHIILKLYVALPFTFLYLKHMIVDPNSRNVFGTAKPFYKACLAQISRTIAFSSLMDCNKTAVSLG